MSLQSNTNNDIFIIPSQSLMQFSGSAANPIVLLVEPSGSVNFVGTTGSILKIMDNLSGSLFSVNNISGLSILEVFSNNQIKMGNPSNYALVVSGSNVIITGSLVDKGTGVKFLVVDTATGVVHTTGSGGGGGSPTTPGGLNSQIQYNSGSAFGGVPDLVYSSSFGLRATGSFTGSFTGSLLGTASFANSASQAITASYINISSSNIATLEVSYATPGVIALLAKTGSGTPVGSVGQLQINAGGSPAVFGAVNNSSYNNGNGQLTLGNLIATGSFTGSLTGIATTASYVNLKAGPRIQAINYNGSEITITGSIGGSDTQIQFNDNNTFNGDSGFTFNNSPKSLQFGSSVTAIGNYSHAEGNFTLAQGDYSHTEGFFVTASGQFSHAEGYITKALGNRSHAEGEDTIAIGNASHAEGSATIASGAYSHTEGRFTTASGDWSHAEGLGTITSGTYQHVQGQYNIPSSTSSAFIIGNGIANSQRSNLVFAADSQFQVTGSARVTGSVLVTGSFSAYNNSTFFTSSFVHDRLTQVGATNPYMSLSLIDGLGVSGSVLELQSLSKGTTVNNYFNGGVNISAYPQPAGTTSGRSIKFINSILGTPDASSFEWHYRSTVFIDSATKKMTLDVPSGILSNSGSIVTSGSLTIASGSTNTSNDCAMYFGTSGSVGSWRIAPSGANLVIQKWNGTAYSGGTTITP